MSGAAAVDAASGDDAWITAMLDAERALAVACGRAGLIPAAAAAAIADACVSLRPAPEELAAGAASAATPVPALVAALVRAVPPSAGPYVHFGATSQDIADSAAMLVVFRSLAPVLDDLGACADACAGLAVRHRDTLMAGRTLLRQAAPTTFGLVAAGWLTALDEVRVHLAAERATQTAAQLGGPVGTRAAFGVHGGEVAALFAAQLGLAEPPLPWHTDRTRITRIAAALGTAAGALGKVARDTALLGQDEIGEAAEAAGGHSSAMPHKNNPAHGVIVAANVHRVPGLVATLMSGMVQEHQRAAGAWQAEWASLTELVRAVGGAAAHARELLSGLLIDTDRMQANLAPHSAMLASAAVAQRLAVRLGRTEAHALVAELARSDTGFAEALRGDERVRDVLTPGEIDALLDPRSVLGSARALVDLALERRP